MLVTESTVYWERGGGASEAIGRLMFFSHSHVAIIYFVVVITGQAPINLGSMNTSLEKTIYVF